MKLLNQLLKTASPSRHEQGVQRIVMAKIKQYGHTHHMDTYGNIVVRIGEQPKTLFTGHMDCVHNHTPVTIQQYSATVNKIAVGQVIALADDCKQRALGADDVVGVRMMLKMIKDGVKALYIFTVEEEIGCLGATHAAKYCPAYIKHAVTFDRKGVGSVITSMSRGTCCSDEYADALITELDMGHHKDTGGSVTDTEKFRSKTLNHTNISAGYHSEHTSKEWLSVVYVMKLLARVSKIDWDGLPMTERPERPVYGGYWDNQGGRRFITASEKVFMALKDCLDLEDAFDAIHKVVRESGNAPYFSKKEFVELITTMQILYYTDLEDMRVELTGMTSAETIEAGKKKKEKEA